MFAVSFPGQEALTTIYSTILAQHLAFRSVPMAVQRMSSQLVASALGKLASRSPLSADTAGGSAGPVASSHTPPADILFILSNQYF